MHSSENCQKMCCTKKHIQHELTNTFEISYKNLFHHEFLLFMFLVVYFIFGSLILS